MFKTIDDEMHFSAGLLANFFAFFLSSIVFTQLTATFIGLVAGIAAAIGKEVYDKKVKKTKFDWRDAKFTILGASLLFTVLIILYIIQNH